ncbi:hypothetical protein CHLRE_07g333605v5 [Chlamydomonas reinhardtii]|uniref:Uncharacterized protein n=1 Tax=Chlamydomonas reinhardtii TaxID=3055 RepID=A0A2K3DK14_CHLRE|nr:uncharacterized protein CHLRE_07g333605v5 [Chlamydomonas reinhardtii]PNW80882.1 hypothetical protein CHLRE_07g333605v5 [Chlamydomonas reinhardtii]
MSHVMSNTVHVYHQRIHSRVHGKSTTSSGASDHRRRGGGITAIPGATLRARQRGLRLPKANPGTGAPRARARPEQRCHARGRRRPDRTAPALGSRRRGGGAPLSDPPGWNGG